MLLRMEQTPVITLMTLQLSLSGCKSLKEKRAILKPLLSFLQREYKLSAAEVGLQDKWHTSLIACVLVSNDGRHNQSIMSLIQNAIEARFPDLEIMSSTIESR